MQSGDRQQKGPRTAGLSAEVRGLVVLVEGAKFNHVLFCGEPDLRVLREPSSALWVLTAAPAVASSCLVAGVVS